MDIIITIIILNNSNNNNNNNNDNNNNNNNNNNNEGQDEGQDKIDIAKDKLMRVLTKKPNWKVPGPGNVQGPRLLVKELNSIT